MAVKAIIEDNIGLGGRIKLLRLANILTGQELANIVGVSKATISQWEKGKTSPTHEKLSILSQFFKVSIGYLIDGDNSVPYFVESDLLKFINAKIKFKQIEPILINYWKDSTEEDKMRLASFLAKNSNDYEKDLIIAVINSNGLDDDEKPEKYILKGTSQE